MTANYPPRTIGRTVDMAPTDTVQAAAAYLAREWDHRWSLGLAGRWTEPDRAAELGPWYIFQCRASDGSRWLIAADRWGNVRNFDPETERGIADKLAVEVTP